MVLNIELLNDFAEIHDKIYSSNSVEVIQCKNKIAPVHTSNRFQLFQDTSEEDLVKLIERARILTVLRRNLKKCRSCNRKKRKCNLNSQQCNARKKICHGCKKKGHNSKSVLCKLNIRSKRQRLKPRLQ